MLWITESYIKGLVIVFIVFGLFKLIKMTLYGFAGILTIKALNQVQKKIWYI